MLKAKSELAKYLEKVILRVVSNSEKCKAICTYAKENYNIPIGMTSDYISMRVEMDQANEFILFCLLDAYEKVTETKKSIVDQYYTMQEVKTYRTSKFEVDTLKFPLVFKVIQVDADQWIGRIDVTTMMKLRAAQLINYNVNTQRTLSKQIKGGKEIYKITINKKAVSSIADLYRKGTYIPTPFTLNIQQDSDVDFYYDEKDCELVIKSIKYFDITDSYHRYLAACQVNDEDKNFNYNMELRITNFSETKAKQFIWQESQKTMMRKVDSNSFDTTKSANIVATRLNENPLCNLQGLIGRSDFIINFGDLAELIHYFYFKEITKEKEKSQIIAVTKELTENFNLLTEHNAKYLEQEYSYKQLVAITTTFYYYNKNEKDKQHMLQIIDSIVDRTESLDNKKFYSKIPKKTMINDVLDIIEEVEKEM